MTTKSTKHSSKKSTRNLTEHSTKRSSHKNKVNRSFVAPLNAVVESLVAFPIKDTAKDSAHLSVVNVNRDWVKLSPQSSWGKYDEAWLMHAAECDLSHAASGIHPDCGVWAWIPEYGTVLLQATDYELASC